MPVDNSFAPPKTCHQMASIPSCKRVLLGHSMFVMPHLLITRKTWCVNSKYYMGNNGMPYAKHVSLGRGTCNDFLSKAWSDTIDPANVEQLMYGCKRTLLVS